MNNIIPFTNSELGFTVEVVDRDGSPWFVAKSICDALGYGNSRDALSKHVRDKWKGVANRDTLGGDQQVSIINEAGVFALVMKSKMPRAIEFQDWVLEEVLPEIRRTGGYQMPGVAVLGLRGWVQVDESCTLGELAGRIRDVGTDCGLKRLVKVLKREGMLERVGERAGLPTLEAEQRGLMTVERFRRVDANASIVTTEVPRVTAKGQMEFCGLVRGESK